MYNLFQVRGRSNVSRSSSPSTKEWKSTHSPWSCNVDAKGWRHQDQERGMAIWSVAMQSRDQLPCNAYQWTPNRHIHINRVNKRIELSIRPFQFAMSDPLCHSPQTIGLRQYMPSAIPNTVPTLGRISRPVACSGLVRRYRYKLELYGRRLHEWVAHWSNWHSRQVDGEWDQTMRTWERRNRRRWHYCRVWLGWCVRMCSSKRGCVVGWLFHFRF